MADAPAAHHPTAEQSGHATPISARPYDPIPRDELPADPAVPESGPHPFEAPRAVAARAQIAAGCFAGVTAVPHATRTHLTATPGTSASA
jgi:hypothetical protein